MPIGDVLQNYKIKNLFLMFIAAVFLFFNFFIITAFKGEAATVPIPDVCSDNLVQTQNEITCYNDGGALPTCGVHAECCTPSVPGGCISDTAVCTINLPTTNAWFTTNEINSGLNYVPNCSVSPPPDFITCARSAFGSCPTGYSASTYTGYYCDIYKENGVDNVYHPATVSGHSGKWDANQQGCITCNGAFENKVCATTGSFFLDASGDCNGAGDTKLESACGADPSCDEQAVGFACAAGKQCDASGKCVASVALSLAASASPNSISIGGTSTITFTVIKGGSPVSGATVSGIAVTAGGGTVSANSCTTGGGGTCTVTYNAPGSATVATISATKASNGTDPDSGPANTSVTVSPCSAPDYSSYSAGSYNVGDTLTLTGHNTNDFSVCIYDGGDSLKQEGNFCASPMPKSIIFVAGSPGIWKGLAVPGCMPGTCPDPFNISAGCPSSATVNPAATPTPTPTPGPCTTDNDCTNVSFAQCIAGSCVECSSNANCAHFFGFTYCDLTASPHSCTVPPGTPTPTPTGTGSPTPTISPPPPSCSGPGFYKSPINYCTVQELLAAATGWILGLVSSIIILVLVIGGIMYVTSTGDEEKMRTAKNIILYAIIGLGIILISYSLITEVKSILKIP